MAIGALAVRVGADVSPFTRSMGRTRTPTRNFQRQMTDSARRVRRFTGAVVAAGTAITAALVKSGLQAVDEQAKLARGLGATTEGLGALARAAGRAGVSKSELETATTRLNQRLGEAVTESGRAAETLDELGLSAQDLSDMDIDERMAAISDSMREAGMSSQEMAFALRNLGIRQASIVNLMQEGGDAIRDSRRRIEEYGLALTQVDAAAVERANDALSEIGIITTGVRHQMAVAFSGTIEAVANQISSQFAEAGGNMQQNIGNAVDFAVLKFADIIEGAGKVAGFVEGREEMAQFGLLGYVLLGKKGALIGAAIGAVFSQVREELAEFGVGIGENEEAARRLRSVQEDIAKQQEIINRRAEILGEMDMEDSFIMDAQAAISDLEAEQMELLKAVESSTEAQDIFNDLMVKGTEDADKMSGALLRLANTLRDSREEGENSGEASTGITPFSGLDDDDADDTAEGAEEESFQRRIDALHRFLSDRRQIEQFDHMDRMEELRSLLQEEAVTQAEFDDMAERMRHDHQQRLTQIDEDAADARKRIAEQESAARWNVASGMFGNLATLMTTESRRLFEIGKAAAMSQALIDGRSAVLSSYRQGASIGGPVLGAAFAGTAGVATAAQIASIANTSFGGGGGGNTGGSTMQSQGTPTQTQGGQAQQGQAATQVNLDLQGDNFSRGAVLGLMEQMNEAIGDGAVLRVNG